MAKQVVAISEADARWHHFTFGRLPPGAWVAADDDLDEMARDMNLVKRSVYAAEDSARRAWEFGED
jgi:predicted signal transduction protein with EAL and GGDEF domain